GFVGKDALRRELHLHGGLVDDGVPRHLPVLDDARVQPARRRASRRPRSSDVSYRPTDPEGGIDRRARSVAVLTLFAWREVQHAEVRKVLRRDGGGCAGGRGLRWWYVRPAAETEDGRIAEGRCPQDRDGLGFPRGAGPRQGVLHDRLGV